MSKRALRKHKRRHGVKVPLASMGDIAFLLLIFFIIAANFTKDPKAEVEMAKSMKVMPMDQARVLVIIDKDQKLYINAEEYDANNTEVLTAEIENLLVGREEPEQRLVHLKIDYRTPKSVYEPVIGSITEAGGVLALIGEMGTPKVAQ